MIALLTNDDETETETRGNKEGSKNGKNEGDNRDFPSHQLWGSWQPRESQDTYGHGETRFTRKK